MTTRTGDIEVTAEDGQVRVASPYHPDLPGEAKALGGRWDATRREWFFDARDTERVHALLAEIYGWTPDQDTQDTVTVRVTLDWNNADTQTVYFAGREIARRRTRDSAVVLGEGVVVVDGEMPWRGGSVRHPLVIDDILCSVVVEVRDLPRGALAAAGDMEYEVVDTAAPDVETLVAERDRLLARLAEVEAAIEAARG